MTDKSKEVARAKGESQEAFEKRVQKEMLAVVKAGERWAKKKHPGADMTPKDVSGKNPVKGGPATKQEQEGRKK